MAYNFVRYRAADGKILSQGSCSVLEHVSYQRLDEETEETMIIPDALYDYKQFRVDNGVLVPAFTSQMSAISVVVNANLTIS